MSSRVPVKTLDQIYKMYMRPHLFFCDVIYHIPKISNLFDSSFGLLNLMGQIQSVQYQAALAVTGTWKGTSTKRFMRNSGGKSFLIEDGFVGLFNSLIYKMVLLLNILKPLFLFPVLISSVPEVKMTSTILNAEQTHT